MKGKKTGGRKKGIPNKVTGDLRERFKQFIVDNFDGFTQEWATIEDPKEKADLFIKAAKYVLPALQSIALHSDDGIDSVEEQLRELAKKAEKK